MGIVRAIVIIDALVSFFDDEIDEAPKRVRVSGAASWYSGVRMRFRVRIHRALQIITFTVVVIITGADLRYMIQARWINEIALSNSGTIVTPVGQEAAKFAFTSAMLIVLVLQAPNVFSTIFPRLESTHAAAVTIDGLDNAFSIAAADVDGFRAKTNLATTWQLTVAHLYPEPRFGSRQKGLCQKQG